MNLLEPIRIRIDPVSQWACIHTKSRNYLTENWEFFLILYEHGTIMPINEWIFFFSIGFFEFISISNKTLFCVTEARELAKSLAL